MFNNESVLKSIARRVFPAMKAFAPNGHAELGVWDACLSVGNRAAWLTISNDRDLLFCIKAQGDRVEATYALPAVMERAGEKEYGTAWASSRRWNVNGWSDVPLAAAGIRKFFENDEEFHEEEVRVHEILEKQSN